MKKDVQVNSIKDGDATIMQRPEAACYDAKGNFIGVPEEGQEVLLGNDSAKADAEKAAE